jgi:hypothetical protein
VHLRTQALEDLVTALQHETPLLDVRHQRRARLDPQLSPHLGGDHDAPLSADAKLDCA